MTYAVIQTGGKQYKVKASEILKIEKLENSKPNSNIEFKEILAYGDHKKIESKIEFKEILAYGDDRTIEVGAPFVDGAKVEAKLIKNGKNRTVLIFKKRRRKNSRRKNGHRQQYSLIKINKIFSKDGNVISEIKKTVNPAKKIIKTYKLNSKYPDHFYEFVML